MAETSERPKWGPILVGTDGSDDANRAVDYAGALTAELKTQLWIIHVTHGTAANAAEYARAEKASIGDATEEIVRRQWGCRRSTICCRSRSLDADGVLRFCVARGAWIGGFPLH